MTARRPGIIDRLAGLVPGYRGYADRDARRTTDKLLRESVAALLDRTRRELDAFTLAQVGRADLDGLDDVARLQSEIGRCADALRHAPAGGSGLMDERVVAAEDLDRAHAHDLEIQEAATNLAGAVALAVSKGDRAALPDLGSRVDAIRAAIERRSAVLREALA